MNERQWFACTNVTKLYAAMGGRRQRGQRAARLFALACCRRVAHLLEDERSRVALSLSELYADGKVTGAGLFPAIRDAWQAVTDFTRRYGTEVIDESAPPYYDEYDDYYEPASHIEYANPAHHWQVFALRAAYHAISGFGSGAAHDTAVAEAQSIDGAALKPIGNAQAALLRDIYGNPFRHYPRTIRATPAVRDLAAALAAGEDCSFALHDALLEMGQPKLAAHFRTGPHVRGCWLAERILGKRTAQPV